MIKYISLNNRDSLTITAENPNISYFSSYTLAGETDEDADVITARLFIHIPVELKNDSIAICAYVRKMLFEYETSNNTELTGFEPMLRIEK